MNDTISTTLARYIAADILQQPDRIIKPDEPLLSSGLVDSFHLVDLSLFVENNFGVRIDDAFGTELLRVQLTDGTANLAPDGTGKASFGFEDNQFISDEPYDKLLSYSVENLKAVIASCEVSNSD